MSFLNPKTDFAFKKIFGSAQSQDILLSFLNAILSLQPPYRLIKVNILDPYLAPTIQGMKDTYLDVRATDESGKHYVIEMQVLNVAGFEKRILYNACKTYAGQLRKGESYHLLTDVIAITITDFVMFEELPKIINRFQLRAEQGQVYSDDLELVFAELPKFNKSESNLTEEVDRWFYFLKHANTLPAVPISLQVDLPIVHAFDIANKAALTPSELENQERREIFIQDQRGALSLATSRGRAEGRVEGHKEGRAEGRVEGHKKGRAEGRVEGHKKGRTEGQILGVRQLLVEQCIQRFGELPLNHRKHIEQADAGQLLVWGERLLTTTNLAEVFQDQGTIAK